MLQSLSRKTVMGLVALGVSGVIFPTGLAAVSSSNFQAGVNIISEDLNSLNVDDLDFGLIKIVNVDPGLPPETVVGTVLLAADTGIRSVDSAGGNVELSGDGNFNRSSYSITGEPNFFYTIIIDPNFTEAHDAGGGGTVLMVEDLKSFSQTNQILNGQGKIDVDGTDTIFVGGNMQVRADAKNGSYTGVVTIDIFY